MLLKNNKEMHLQGKEILVEVVRMYKLKQIIIKVKVVQKLPQKCFSLASYSIYLGGQ